MDRAALKEKLGAELGVAPETDNQKTLRLGKGDKGKVPEAVTSPLEQLGPAPGGVYESSYPSSSSRSAPLPPPVPATASDLRQFPLPGLPGKRREGKEKSGWQRSEPVLKVWVKSEEVVQGKYWPGPLKGPLLRPSVCWSGVPASCTSGSDAHRCCSGACGLGAGS